jgi:hypothetical protein
MPIPRSPIWSPFYGALALPLLAAGCGGSPPDPLGRAPSAAAHAAPVAGRTPAPSPGGAAGAEAGFRLVDVAAERGLDFRHSCGPRRPLTIVDTMGGGCAFVDFDADGRQDIFLVSSGQDFRKPRQVPGSKLFRNVGSGRFEDVTSRSGIVIDGFATGCSIGDYDNDGREDLFVGGFGRNWLYRNRGDGTFQDVTTTAGLLRRPGAWGVGSAFVDVNRDGKLDLYVGNYVRFEPSIPLCRTANILHGCTPNQYSTQRNELYINQGNGRFVERAAQLGAESAEGASLGIVVSDFDNDGWPDLFIANDGTPNALLHNLKGRFKDVAQQAGVAYAEDGVMRAGMGTDAGDLDGDGLPDVVVANWQTEPTSVFRNEGRMSFTDRSFPSGVGTPSLNHLKFGISLADLDGDGRLDIYQGNGHVFDNVEEFNDIDKFEQVDQVFMNTGGGSFRELAPSTGAVPAVFSVTRAVAAGDFNDDGAADILINSLDRPVRLLENQRARPVHWIGLKLVGTRSNRSAIGARVELAGPGGRQVREVRSGGSYIGQSDLRPLFNLGPAASADGFKLRVRWPNGTQQEVTPIVLDRYTTVKEPL